MPVSSRRVFLSCAATLAASPLVARAYVLSPAALVFANSHSISMTNLHTRETMSLVFGSDVDVTNPMHRTFNRFLRDHYSGDVTKMDPALITHLVAIQQSLGIKHSHFEVISGYRSPKTNAMLRRRGARVARHSMHMSGQAIDIRLHGTELAELRDVALDLKAGGVGYYPRSRFLHFDTGRVRHW
ncbi:MAG: DUF882 domain-containing protein [Burkholderiaceae bacterium]